MTTSERDMLSRAVELVERFGESDGCRGVFPRGAGQWRTVRSLERKGLLVFHGYGRDIDGNGGNEVAIFAPTDAGKLALTEDRP